MVFAKRLFFVVALTSVGVPSAFAATKCPDKPWTTNKELSSRDDLLKIGWAANSALNAKDPQGAQAECGKRCWDMGEGAPCGWYTIIQWLDGNKMSYECYLKNARDLKGINNPRLPKDKNLGTGGASLTFKDSWTYTCNEARPAMPMPAPAKKK